MATEVTIVNVRNNPYHMQTMHMCGNQFSAGIFGYGFPQCNNMFFNPCCMNLSCGIGQGLGFALGSACISFMPQIIKGVGNACSFVWNRGILPGAKWIGNGISNAWSKGIVPTAKWIENGVAKGCKVIKNGVVNCWNKIFHKNTEKTE